MRYLRLLKILLWPGCVRVSCTVHSVKPVLDLRERRSDRHRRHQIPTRGNSRQHPDIPTKLFVGVLSSAALGDRRQQHEIPTGAGITFVPIGHLASLKAGRTASRFAWPLRICVGAWYPFFRAPGSAARPRRTGIPAWLKTTRSVVASPSVLSRPSRCGWSVISSTAPRCGKQTYLPD